jgi:hypothetical protein
MLIDEQWFTTEQLANVLNVDSSTLRRWRTSTPMRGPAFVRLSSRVAMYSAHDVEVWLRSHRVEPGRAA